jgi:hypothetical protein
VFLSGVLCFMMVPTTMGKSTPAFLDKSAAEWMPVAWFFGLFEILRGSKHPGLGILAERALIAVLISVVAAIAVTFAGYWKQMRAALAPSARVAASARWRRAFARLLTGRDRAAAGTSDFILNTLARSRPQQVPIAIMASMAVAIVSVAISTRSSGIEALYRPRTVVRWIPMVIGYWIIVGVRSSFALPTELPAAWVFRVHSRERSASYWVGMRAAMISFALFPALAVNALVVWPLVGWRVAAWNAAFVCVAVTFAAQAASITIESVPFTRAYPPGHTKLKTRWPLYFGGMYAVAYWPVRWELGALRDPSALLMLVAGGLVAIVLVDLVGRRAALEWKIQPDIEVDGDPEALTFLNLGPDAGHKAQPAT